MSADIGERVRSAKEGYIRLMSETTVRKDAALEAMAQALDRDRGIIKEANAADMSAAQVMVDEGKLTTALMKRLRVDDTKIDEMIAGIRDVMRLPDPVGRTLQALELDDGLELYQVSTPIGLIGVIFESRPDVVPQIMALCLKSGNATIFKGGSEAKESNRAIFNVLTEAIATVEGMPYQAFQLMETRDDVTGMLGMDDYIDLIIPRGSNEFVRYIQDNTRIPVLGHAAGICHVYIDRAADPEKARDVAVDSKVQYAAVCNAVETLLVHEEALSTLTAVARDLVEKGVELRCDTASRNVLEQEGVPCIDASEEDWDSEYNDLIVSIRVVDSLEEAVRHINLHGSGHTDCIVTEDSSAAIGFVSKVDSSSVMVNASTRFADGFRYGKGAEVGISTNKIHARGPVGMEGLMIYKYVLMGDGHAVKDYAGKGAKPFTHRRLTRDLEIR